MLCIQDKAQLKSPFPPASIRQLEIALDSTFVILFSCPRQRCDKICHIDHEGKEIIRYFKGSYSKFTMLSEESFMVKLESHAFFVDVNLKSKKMTKMDFNFSLNKGFQLSRTFFFSNTKFICFEEQKILTFQDNRKPIILKQDRRLTYGLRGKQIIKFNFDSKSKIELLQKMNNDSSIAILEVVKRQQHLTIHEVVEQMGKWESKVRSFKLEENPVKDYLFRWRFVHQVCQDQLFIFKNRFQDKKHVLFNLRKEEYHVRSSVVPGKYLYLDNVLFMDEVTVFKKGEKTTYLKQKLSNFILVFVNNETNEAIESHPIDKDTYLYNIQVCEYNPSILVEWWQSKKEADILTVQKTTTATLREIYLHSLLHLDQDFDDDLLQDVLKLFGFE